MGRSELAADLAAILLAIHNEGRDALASEQRRIDFLRQQLEACDREDGLEELRAKQRAWLSREAEMFGIPNDDEEPPWRR
jgi:hypothetical protein